MFTAVRLPSRHDYAQSLLLRSLARRTASIRGTFWQFGLEPMGYGPGDRTVQDLERNRIELFGNLGLDARARLRGEAP